jgi:hypothetical protein
MNAQVFTTPRIIPNERLFAVGQVDKLFQKICKSKKNILKKVDILTR